MSLLDSRSQSSPTTSSLASVGFQPTKTSRFSSRPPGLSSDIRSTSSAEGKLQQIQKKE
uniref:Uncharacterized protein n=1 Tax=Nelumbo nucifera TaxID=4432 RepID=A0A822ZYR7_NELNU|nr:TPA_asm: hypothetical protein HUJ06_018608 [Nelumbo nucifera]